MKKFLTIMTILGVTLLTAACGNTGTKEAEEATEVTTEVENAVETTDEVVQHYVYTEEYVEELRTETINQIEETWEEEGISEACKNDIIELMMSIEYDVTFEYGYDLDSLQRDYVDILVHYGLLPVECAGHNFDELEAAESLEDL